MSTELAIAKLGPDAERHAFVLENAMIAGKMVSPLEKAHFVAQVAHESSGFKRLTENLNYSAQRLGEVFKKYFPTAQLRNIYAYNPVMVANRVYADRMGNGDENSGDGWRYRGRGFIQLTGKENYAAASQDLFGDDRLLQNPDLAQQPEIAAKTAVWFWRKNNLTALALEDNIEGVTRKINGSGNAAVNGIEDRRIWLNRAKRAFRV